MIDKDEIELSMIFHELFQTLKNSQVNHDAVSQACVLMDLVGDIGDILIGLDSMDHGISVRCHQQARKSTIASKLQYGFGGCIFENIYQYFPFLFSDIHHPVRLAELIDGLDDGRWVAFGGCGQHVLEKAGFDIFQLAFWLGRVFLIVPQVLATFLVWHLEGDLIYYTELKCNHVYPYHSIRIVQFIVMQAIRIFNDSDAISMIGKSSVILALHHQQSGNPQQPPSSKII